MGEMHDDELDELTAEDDDGPEEDADDGDPIPASAYRLGKDDWTQYLRGAGLSRAEQDVARKKRRRLKNRGYQKTLRQQKAKSRAPQQSAEQLARRIAQLVDALARERRRSRALEERLAAHEV